MLKIRLLAFAALLLALPAVTAADKADSGKLAGTYTIVSGQRAVSSFRISDDPSSL